jgi:uncharacterized coiled-coil protein SlyX
MAINFQDAPHPAADPGRPPRTERKSRSSRLPATSRRDAPSSLRGLIEIVGETLWVGLLAMVIGLLSWKVPQISAAIDEISGSTHRPAASAGDSGEGRIRELEIRIAGYENKLAPMEKNFAQLKQRHSDLQKAYDALRANTVQDAFARHAGESITPPAAP